MDVLITSSKVDPISSCELEIDCLSGDILNCLDVQGYTLFV